MRKLVFLTLVISIFFSCKKDTKPFICPPPIGGSITIGDSLFPLQENVIIENMGKRQTGFFHDSTDGFLFLVQLMDPRLILNPDTTLEVQFYMQHIPIITIVCYSASPDSLLSGTYPLSTSQPHPPFSFSRSLVSYNYIYEQGGGTFNFRYPKIKQGSFTFEHLCDETYNISIDATLDNGLPYKGSLSSRIIQMDSR